jgi:glycine/D-amino acid oxidase-like deaminating enzyme
MEKIVVIGAGIMGASLAWALAGAGRDVMVVEAGLPAGGASGRSFGWINASFHLSRAHFDLRLAGIAAHRRLMAALPGLHRFDGCLWWEEAGAEMDRMEAELRSLRYPVERLGRAQVQAREPGLASPPDEALLFAAEGAVEPADLVPRLLARPGIRVLAGLPVTLALQGGQVVGVETALGRIPADQVVIAAGIGAPALLARLGLRLPMLDRPGMLLRTRPVAARLRHILAAPDQEVRQDASGRLIGPMVGAHQGDSGGGLGPADAMTAATLARIGAMLDVTGLEAEVVLHALRPVPGDGLPVLGPVAAAPGLWLAVLHSGVTLAPLAGELLAAEMTGQGEQGLLAAFRPERLM